MSRRPAHRAGRSRFIPEPRRLLQQTLYKALPGFPAALVVRHSLVLKAHGLLHRGKLALSEECRARENREPSATVEMPLSQREIAHGILCRT